MFFNKQEIYYQEYAELTVLNFSLQHFLSNLSFFEPYVITANLLTKNMYLKCKNYS